VRGSVQSPVGTGKRKGGGRKINRLRFCFRAGAGVVLIGRRPIDKNLKAVQDDQENVLGSEKEEGNLGGFLQVELVRLYRNHSEKAA